MFGFPSSFDTTFKNEVSLDRAFYQKVTKPHITPHLPHHPLIKGAKFVLHLQRVHFVMQKELGQLSLFIQAERLKTHKGITTLLPCKLTYAKSANKCHFFWFRHRVLIFSILHHLIWPLKWCVTWWSTQVVNNQVKTSVSKHFFLSSAINKGGNNNNNVTQNCFPVTGLRSHYMICQPYITQIFQIERKALTKLYRWKTTSVFLESH